MFKPPEGYHPVPGSKHGGWRKPKPGGGYDYWYPYQQAASSASYYYERMTSTGPLWLNLSEDEVAEHKVHAAGSEVVRVAMLDQPTDLVALRGYLLHTVEQVAALRDQVAAAAKKLHKQELDAINNVIRVGNEVHDLHAQVHDDWNEIAEAIEEDEDADSEEYGDWAPNVDTEPTEETDDVDDNYYDPEPFVEWEEAFLAIYGGRRSAELAQLQAKVRGSAARVKAAIEKRDRVLQAPIEDFSAVVNQANDAADHAYETYEALWDEAQEAYEAERDAIIEENEALDEEEAEWEEEEEEEDEDEEWDEEREEDEDGDDTKASPAPTPIAPVVREPAPRREVPPEWVDRRADLSPPNVAVLGAPGEYVGGMPNMSALRRASEAALNEAVEQLNDFLDALKKAPLPPVPMAKGVWRVRPIDRLRGLLSALQRMAV